MGSPVSALTTVPLSEGCCAAVRYAHTSQKGIVRSRQVALAASYPGGPEFGTGPEPSHQDARGESRTLMGLPPTDFESVASAIPPLGPGSRGEIYPQTVRCSCPRASPCRTPASEREMYTRAPTTVAVMPCETDRTRAAEGIRSGSVAIAAHTSSQP